MLEAENRVLRLRSEQDKAHLTASQMLAKDLGAASPTRGQPAPHSPDGSAQQQLADMREALERERRAGAARVEQLEAQIAELRAAASTVDGRGDAAGDNPRLVELQSELEHTVASHAKELAEAHALHSELSSRLEQSTAKVAGLQTELDAKDDEVSALSANLNQRSADLGRAEQQCHDMAEERDGRPQGDQPSPSEDSTLLVARYYRHLAQLAAAMQEACGDAPEGAPDDTADPAALIDWTQQLATSLAERHALAAARADALAEDVRAKDAALADFERRLGELACDTAGRDLDGSSRSAQTAAMQERIAELEAANVHIAEERDQFAKVQAELESYLYTLESQCEQLEADIELLRTDNKRLADDLSIASLQNSTVSLDIGTADGRLLGDSASSSSDAKLQLPGEAVMAQMLSEMESRKDSEIKRLQDEIGSLEDMIEDKVFGESEQNDRVTALTREVDRLQRELARARNAGGGATAAAAADDNDDGEYMLCHICDSRGHETADCPELATKPDTLFKQEVPVDLSRPYCDNCESFAGHWTGACPHGDEMF